MLRFKPLALVRKLAFSVGAKINFIFGFMVVLVIAFSYYGKTVLDRYSAAYDRQVALHSAILQLKGSFSNCGTAISDYFKTGNRTRLAAFNNHFEEAKAGIKELYGRTLDDEMLYLLRSVEISSETYFRECSTASFQYNTKNFAYYGKLYYAESILAYLQKYCDELAEQILVNGLTENAALREERSVLRFWNGIFNGFLIMLLIGFFLYVTSRITHPLGKLVLQARAISAGDFDVRVHVQNPNNSVGVLSQTFNSMAASIKTMMQEVQDKVATEKKLLEERHKNVEYQELLNQATFIALQTQTNPHFLFNTLNSISRSVTLGKKEQTLSMIDALASLLRYSLLDASEPVLLREELSVTKEYLKIQTVRFKDRIKADFKIEESIEDDVSIPRFSLQPIVENAVIHGLEPKMTSGRLLISAKRRSGRAIIRVYDDGSGIARAKLESIKQQQTQSASKRIGIWNTQKRIRLFTHSEDSFSIASREGGGTLVTIKLPLGTKGNV